jgi:hypothetical protein
MKKRISIIVSSMLIFACIILPQADVSAASIKSSLYPVCWGGEENQELYFVSGEVQRLLVLYRNDMKEDATDVAFRLDLPKGFEVIHACCSSGHTDLKTEFTRTDIVRNGKDYVRVILSMYDIKAGIAPIGDKVSEWGFWKQWYTYFIIRGPENSGAGTLYWQLTSAQGKEEEQSVTVNVLPPLKPVVPAKEFSIGYWAYRPLMYGSFPEVAEELFKTYRAAGIGKVFLQDSTAPKVVNGWFQMAKKYGVKPLLTQWWPYTVFSDTEPAEVEGRAVNDKGKLIKGKAWCPQYIADKGVHYKKFLDSVTEKMKRTGADGLMLDYEGTGAPGVAAKDMCFCERCRKAFEYEIGEAVKNWPADVRPGAVLHDRWLEFRCQQSAWYIRNMAEAAKAGNPDAVVENWSGGYYKPYPVHRIYSSACSDITKFAPYLTGGSIGTYVYPTDADKELTPTLKFGNDKTFYGSSLADMIEIIRDTVQQIAPVKVYPCVAGSHTLGLSATPLASVKLLRYQALEHLMDGAYGLQYWGLGMMEDGRYLVLTNELARVYSAVEDHVLKGVKVKPPVIDQPVGTRVTAWEYNGNTIMVILNKTADQNLSIAIKATGKVSDPVNGLTLESKDGVVTFELDSLEAKVLKLQ